MPFPHQKRRHKHIKNVIFIRVAETSTISSITQRIKFSAHVYDVGFILLGDYIQIYTNGNPNPYYLVSPDRSPRQGGFAGQVPLLLWRLVNPSKLDCARLLPHLGWVQFANAASPRESRPTAMQIHTLTWFGVKWYIVT